jgi:hypothetical protein
MKNENWGSGEWDNEPDLIEWIDDYSGYECRVRRNKHAGFLCGTVVVPETNRFHGMNYHDLKDAEFNVHQGISISGFDRNGKYRIGFRCNLGFDIVPHKKMLLYVDDGDTYKNISYVKEQTERLAKQIYEMQYRNYLKPCRG